MTILTRLCVVVALLLSASAALGACDDKKNSTETRDKHADDRQSETSKDSPTAATGRERKSHGETRSVLENEKGLETESGAQQDSPETR